jgi:hypothetical protein
MEGGEESISWRMIFPENRWPPFPDHALGSGFAGDY